MGDEGGFDEGAGRFYVRREPTFFKVTEMCHVTSMKIHFFKFLKIHILTVYFSHTLFFHLFEKM